MVGVFNKHHNYPLILTIISLYIYIYGVYIYIYIILVGGYHIYHIYTPYYMKINAIWKLSLSIVTVVIPKLSPFAGLPGRPAPARLIAVAHCSAALWGVSLDPGEVPGFAMEKLRFSWENHGKIMGKCSKIIYKWRFTAGENQRKYDFDLRFYEKIM